jgi:hypothetical protein
VLNLWWRRISTLLISARTEEEVGRTVVIMRERAFMNTSTAVACEVLARRIVHQSPSEKIKSLMSTRYRHREADGDISEASSALEIAIDTHWLVLCSCLCNTLTCCYIVPYSCLPAKHRVVSLPKFTYQSGMMIIAPVVRALWDGELVQTLTDQDDIQCEPIYSRSISTLNH